MVTPSISQAARQIEIFDKAVSLLPISSNINQNEVASLQDLALNELMRQFKCGEISVNFPMPAGLRVITLDNGFTIYFQNRRIEKTTVGVASVKILTKTGYLAETPEIQDISHLLEHCLFLGTEKYSGEEVDNLIKKFNGLPGADNNATTSYDRTDYYFHNIPTRDLALFQDAVDLLFQLTCKATFPLEKVAKERLMVVNEHSRRSVTDVEYWNIYYTNFFPDKQFAPHRPRKLSDTLINCNERELQERLFDFYKTWYTPHNMALFVVGDFEDEQGSRTREEEIFQFIIDTFNQMPPSSSQVRLPSAAVACMPEQPIYAEQINSNLSGASISVYQNVSHNNYTNPLAQHISNIKLNLQDRIMQMAFIEFKNSNANDVCNYSFRALPSPPSYTTKTFIEKLLYIGVNEGKLAENFQKTLAAIKKFIPGVHPDEIASFLDGFVSCERIGLQESASKAHNIFIDGYVRWDKAKFFNFPHISPIDNFSNSVMFGLIVRHYTQFEKTSQLFDNIALFDPKRHHELLFYMRSGGTQDKLSEIRKVMENVSQLSEEINEEYTPLKSDAWLPSKPSSATIVLKEEIPGGIDCKRILLDNGINIILKKTEDPDPSINLHWFKINESPYSSSSLEEASISYALQILPQLPLGGLSARDYVLSKRGHAFGLQSYAFGHNVLVSSLLVAKPEQLELGLKHFYLMLTDRTRFCTPEFEMLFNNKLKTSIELSKKNATYIPTLCAQNESQLLWGDHPLCKNLQGEDLEKITLEDALAKTEKILDQSAKEHLLVCGNFDAETIEPLIVDYIGGLPRANDVEEAVKWDVPEIPRETLIKLEIDNQPDRYTTTLALPYYVQKGNHMFLELPTRSILSKFLNDKLRKEDQKTYGLQTNLKTHPLKDTYGYLTIKFVCDEKARDDLKANVLELLEKCQNWTKEDIEPYIKLEVDYHNKSRAQTEHLTKYNSTLISAFIQRSVPLEEYNLNKLEEYPTDAWLDTMKHLLSGLNQYKELIIAPKQDLE